MILCVCVSERKKEREGEGTVFPLGKVLLRLETTWLKQPPISYGLSDHMHIFLECLAFLTTSLLCVVKNKKAESCLSLTAATFNPHRCYLFLFFFAVKLDLCPLGFRLRKKCKETQKTVCVRVPTTHT